MRACSVSEQDSHIPLDRRTFLRWLSRCWRGQHESGSPSFSINPITRASRVRSSEFWGSLAEYPKTGTLWQPKTGLRRCYLCRATSTSTHVLAINPADAAAMGNRRSRKGVQCRRHRSVGHRPASTRPARARPEVPRRRTGSPPLRSQSGDRLAVVVPRPCAMNNSAGTP